MLKKIKGDATAHRKYQCRKELAACKKKKRPQDGLACLREEVAELRAIVEKLLED